MDNRSISVFSLGFNWRETLAVLAAILALITTTSSFAQESTSDEDFELAGKKVPIPFEKQIYKIKVLISFSNDARLTPRLRSDVLRRLLTHTSAYVGDIWQLEIQDVSGTLALSTQESIATLTAERIEAYTEDKDKVFVLGIEAQGDRFVLGAREFDVAFTRWGPLFPGSARETTQVARELLLLASRMFSPLARFEDGDTKRVVVVIKGGRLPTLNPDAIDSKAQYKPSFQFVPNGALFRPMRPVYNEDRSEIIGVTPMGWTFYVVEGRDKEKAMCKIDSALSRTLPPTSTEPDEPQIILARTAGGNTRLRLVDPENKAPLPAMDVERVETIGGASLPLGTTDSDGSIMISPNPNRSGSGLVWVFVRHGRDTMARLPILPGAGEEPNLELRPDEVRLDIEGRVMAMQTQIVDQVARRTILSGARSVTTNVLEGGLIRSAIKKKEWKQAQNFLKQLKDSPVAETMMTKLEDTKEYARSLRPEEKWSGKIKRMFGETQDIIERYFNPDEFLDVVEELEDDLKVAMEDAAEEAKIQAGAPAGSGS